MRVTDRRTFQLNPPDPSSPSLKYGEIDNPAITSRAIARKRSGYGMAMGDILLPEGQTVEQLATTALTRGLREAGFRVLLREQEGYEQAIPLEADIRQFWAWFSPGLFAAHLEFDARIQVTGPVEPFVRSEEYRGYVRLATEAATTSAWLNTVNRGLESLDHRRHARAEVAQPLAARPQQERPRARLLLEVHAVEAGIGRGERLERARGFPVEAARVNQHPRDRHAVAAEDWSPSGNRSPLRARTASSAPGW